MDSRTNLNDGFCILLRSLWRIWIVCRCHLTVCNPSRLDTASNLTMKYPSVESCSIKFLPRLLSLQFQTHLPHHNCPETDILPRFQDGHFPSVTDPRKLWTNIGSLFVTLTWRWISPDIISSLYLSAISICNIGQYQEIKGDWSLSSHFQTKSNSVLMPISDTTVDSYKTVNWNCLMFDAYVTVAIFLWQYGRIHDKCDV